MKDVFLILVSDYMSKYTLQDLNKIDNVKVVNRVGAFRNRIIEKIFRFHTAVKVNNIINIPFKTIWYNLLFLSYIKNKSPNYIVMTHPWFNKELMFFFRKKLPSVKIILQCQDTVAYCLKSHNKLSINILKDYFDGIVVYNELDAKKYGLYYHPVGYSKIDKSTLPSYEHVDVCFIGAAKNRLNEIREVYKILTDSGLKCFFYVTEVPESQKCNDGLIYGEIMSFEEYLGREMSADCLVEIIQNGSTGRTYRMMEAIIYNKKLITNCPECKKLSYYDDRFFHYFTNVNKINPDFVKNRVKPDYKYKGEFSPIELLNDISMHWR